MRTRTLPACAFALLICFAPESIRAEVTNETPDFSRYPQPPQKPFGGNELSAIIASHTHDCFLSDNRNALIEIFSFQLVPEAGGQNTWMVKQNGREFEARNVWNWAVQNSFSRQLTTSEVADLLAAIKTLPTENTYPDLSHLTIVSFRDGTKWITRCYNQASPPEALKTIHEIIDKARMLTWDELDAEAEVTTKHTVATARAANPVRDETTDLKIEDAVSKCEAIFVGTLNDLDGPRDAQFGEARYYGRIENIKVLLGPTAGQFVSIDAKLLPLYHENEPNIFFLIKTAAHPHPATTVGAEYTALKFLPATDDNIAKVKRLIVSAPASK